MTTRNIATNPTMAINRSNTLKNDTLATARIMHEMAMAISAGIICLRAVIRKL